VVPHGPRGCVAPSRPLPPAHSWLSGPSPGSWASQPPPPLAQPVSESASDSGCADEAPSPPLPSPPSLLPGPSSPAPGWAQARACCAPHPLLAQLARPRCSREEAAVRAPQAPPAHSPSREAGRPARPGPRWVSASSGQRVGPPRAEAPAAGTTPVIAPGPAGGRANIPFAALGRGRARGCSHFWARAGATWGLCLLGTAGPAGSPSDEATPCPRAESWGPRRLAAPRRLWPCPAGPGGYC
jgi:hypothetical protein